MKKLTLLLALILFSLPVFAQDWTQDIRILIKAKTPQGDFQDAIYKSPGEFAKLSKEDIDKEVKGRADAWVAFVASQSSKPPVIPTKEELKESATAQLDQAQATVDKLIQTDLTKEEAQALIDKLQKQITDLAAKTGIEVKPAEVIVP